MQVFYQLARDPETQPQAPQQLIGALCGVSGCIGICHLPKAEPFPGPIENQIFILYSSIYRWEMSASLAWLSVVKWLRTITNLYKMNIGYPHYIRRKWCNRHELTQINRTLSHMRTAVVPRKSWPPFHTRVRSGTG